VPWPSGFSTTRPTSAATDFPSIFRGWPCTIAACRLAARWSTCGPTRPKDPAVRKPLDRLRRTLQPVQDDGPGFLSVAVSLTQRAALFAELRKALCLRKESSRRKLGSSNGELTPLELNDIRSAVRRLSRSLRKRRPKRGPPQEQCQAIDIVLSHLEAHGRYLWGHAIRLPEKAGGGVRLVDRTNNTIESHFHALKRGERRRSGRKILTQDFEKLPPAAVLAANLTHADYVSILCGSLDRLPEAFAKLDDTSRPKRRGLVSLLADHPNAESASLPTADRKIVRTSDMTRWIIEAAQQGLRKRNVA